ncbi:MAG TPA: LacI family transcriptional regulator [Sphaerochaeta sp.]|jgi:LacI family transcriptional regulator|nr:LacI family transcriptional regulator [Sphaerochaeta sp.]
MGIKEIAEKAGVSKTTVSLALNGHKGVGHETRMAIIRIAKEMNYRVPGERSYALPQHGVIVLAKLSKHGLILNEDQNTFIVNYIEGINQVVKEYGYSFEIITHSLESLTPFISEMKSKQPKGIIVLGTELSSPDIQCLKDLSYPYVIIDTYFEQLEADFITMGNIGSVYTIISYLVKRHHTDIRMVTSTVSSGNISLRERGFIQAMNEYGLTLSEQSLIPVKPGFNGAYKEMLAYLQGGGHLPQALFCFNDVAAFGVIKAIKEAGFKVPRDVSVIGFDDLPMSSMMEPRLTTVKIPTQHIGALAARTIVEKIIAKTKEAPMDILVHGKLVIRESVIDR